jgi:anti-anti-sigma regulatory factor
MRFSLHRGVALEGEGARDGRGGAGDVVGVGRQCRVMPARDFALALERLTSTTTRLVLVGELDLYRAPEIEDALAQAIEPDSDSDPRRGSCGPLSADGCQGRGDEATCLVVDLRSVTFLDSSTLMVLLAASDRQRARGGELLVLVGPETPTTAFEVTGFDRLLAIIRVDADAEERTA